MYECVGMIEQSIEVVVVANQYLWRFTGIGILLGEIYSLLFFIRLKPT